MATLKIPNFPITPLVINPSNYSYNLLLHVEGYGAAEIFTTSTFRSHATQFYALCLSECQISTYLLLIPKSLQKIRCPNSHTAPLFILCIASIFLFDIHQDTCINTTKPYKMQPTETRK